MEVNSSGNTEMLEVIDFNDLVDGKLKLTKVGDARIVLARQGDTVHAVAAMCSHAKIFLAPGKLGSDGLIECPMHGAKFSPIDGSVKCPPATQPIAVHATKIVDGKVFVSPVGEIKDKAYREEKPLSPWEKWAQS